MAEIKGTCVNLQLFSWKILSPKYVWWEDSMAFLPYHTFFFFECYMLLSFGVRLINIYFLFLCPQYHSQFIGKHIYFPTVLIYPDCGNILSRFSAMMELIFLAEHVRGQSPKPCGLVWVVILCNLTSLLRSRNKGFFFQEEGRGGPQLKKKAWRVCPPPVSLGLISVFLVKSPSFIHFCCQYRCSYWFLISLFPGNCSYLSLWSLPLGSPPDPWGGAVCGLKCCS